MASTVSKQFRSVPIGGAAHRSRSATDGRALPDRPGLNVNLGPLFCAFGLYRVLMLDYGSGTDMLARASVTRQHARRVYDSLHWMPVGVPDRHDPWQVIS